jgi:hypothetical protein
MKFMIINRPTGHNAGGVSKNPSHQEEWAEQIRKWLKDEKLECCYHMVSGGHVYVVNSDTIHDLSYRVRSNPLFEESHTEVIPITDAADFLDEHAEFMKSRS